MQEESQGGPTVIGRSVEQAVTAARVLSLIVLPSCSATSRVDSRRLLRRGSAAQALSISTTIWLLGRVPDSVYRTVVFITFRPVEPVG